MCFQKTAEYPFQGTCFMFRFFSLIFTGQELEMYYICIIFSFSHMIHSLMIKKNVIALIFPTAPLHFFNQQSCLCFQ